MTDLRKYAEGKNCNVRLPGYCNRDPLTTVLAHDRMAGITGIGQKAPDLLGAWTCSTCHDVVDGRVRTDLEPIFIRLCFLEGIERTLYALIREGVLRS